jgi:hypothetical protein
MNTYQVFSVHNTFISAHDSPSVALKHALIYQHVTGQPAHVEQVSSDAAHQAADDLADWQAQGGEPC